MDVIFKIIYLSTRFWFSDYITILYSFTTVTFDFTLVLVIEDLKSWKLALGVLH